MKEKTESNMAKMNKTAGLHGQNQTSGLLIRSCCFKTILTGKIQILKVVKCKLNVISDVHSAEAKLT